MIGQPPLSGPTRFSCGHAHVGEEHLVEVAEVRVGQLGERPALDAGRRHVDDQRADALVLRQRRGRCARSRGTSRRGARPTSTPSGRSRRTRRRRARRGSRRLARSLPAPGSLMPRHHEISARSVGSEEPLLLLGGAVVVDRRGDDAEALRVQRCAGSRGATSPRSRSSAASASRCARRARAASRARASRRRTASRCHVARPLRHVARSTASARCSTLVAAGRCASSHATSSARNASSSGRVLQAHRGAG